MQAGQLICFLELGSSFAAGVLARAGVGASELDTGVPVRLVSLGADEAAGVSVRPTLQPTPQSAHLVSGPSVVPAGNGLAKPHTPQVQFPTSAGLSRPVSGSSKSGSPEVLTTGPRPRYSVILGEERMKPV